MPTPLHARRHLLVRIVQREKVVLLLLSIDNRQNLKLKMLTVTGGKLDGLKAQFLSLRSNRSTIDEYENMDLPSLYSEKERLTKRIAEARQDERALRKLQSLEESLSQVNSRISFKESLEVSFSSFLSIPSPALSYVTSLFSKRST